jgi:hypothetical protein
MISPRLHEWGYAPMATSTLATLWREMPPKQRKQFAGDGSGVDAVCPLRSRLADADRKY